MRKVQTVVTSTRDQDHVYRVIPVSMYPEIIWPYGFAIHSSESLVDVEVDIYRKTENFSEVREISKSGIVGPDGAPAVILKKAHHYKYHHSRMIRDAHLH